MAATRIQIVSLFLMVFLVSMERVNGHGYMIKPPMRSSMWRSGFSTPQNYDDRQLWCGGYGTQYWSNGGRCGECGDNWADPRPRANDEGGKYGTGVIAATYTQGQVIDVQVELTANHGGFLEFRLCADKRSANELTTDECFNKNLLQLENYSTRYIIGLATGGNDTVNLKVRLPAGVSCEYCVFQMWWKTDINSNQCGNQTIGCGNQEEYKNCADVRIVSNGGGGITNPSTPSPIVTTPPTTFVCPSPNGYYADPNACNAYYQCSSGSANRGTCPDRFYFDSTTLFCTSYSSGGGCGSRPFVCPSNGYFQIPGKSCSSSFYNCFNGIPNTAFCPGTSIFNPDNGSCQSPSNISGC